MIKGNVVHPLFYYKNGEIRFTVSVAFVSGDKLNVAAPVDKNAKST